MNEDLNLDDLLGGLFWAFISLTLLPLIDGYTIKSLWNWFAHPFFNTPLMTIWTAMGLNLLWHSFAYKSSTKATTSTKETFSLVKDMTINNAIACVLMFVFGYFLHRMVG